MRYCFGSFVLDDKTGSVASAGGEEVKLRPQTFRLLAVLVKSYPRILSRDQLIDEVWGAEHVSAGSLPQAISELRQALGDDPQKPRFIETIHRRGYRFVCPVSVASTMVFLLPKKKQGEEEEPRRFGLGLAVAVALIAALVMTALVLAWRYANSSPDAESTAEPVSRPAIAVFELDDLAGQDDAAWLSSALAEMISSELALAGDLRVVPGATVAKVKADLELDDVASGSVQAVERLTTLLDVDRLVVGNYLRQGEDAPQLRVDLQLLDRTAQQIAAIRLTAPESELFALVTQLGDELLRHLASSEHGEMSREAASSPSVPASGVTRALQLYFEGLAALRGFDPTTAHQLLTTAAELEPGSPRIDSALAQALWALGQEDQARATIARAHDASSALPSEERQSIAGLYFEIHGDPAAALAVYSDLAEAYADNPEHAARLAAAQIAAGQSREMLAGIDELQRRFRAPATRARFDLLEAEAAGAISEATRQKAAASRAAQYGDEVGARWLTGQALLLESQAASQLGDLEEAIDLAERARHLHAERGDPHQVAAILNVLAELHFDHGDLDVSRRLGEEALEASRRLGNQRTAGQALGQLARVAFHSGDVQASRDMLRQAFELYRETGERRGIACLRQLEAEMLVYQGDVAAAWDRTIEALAAWQEIGDRYREASVLQTQGNLLARMSRFDDALASWDRAVALFTELGDRRGAAQTYGMIAGVYTARGRLREARELLTRELAYYRSIDNPRSTARALYGIALIDFRTGRPEQARATLEEAIQSLSSTGDRLATCFVERKLGDVLQHQGDLAAARPVLERALAASRHLEHKIAEGLVLGNLGWLTAREGDLETARRHLDDARSIQEAMGDQGNALGNELLLADLDLLSEELSRAERRTRQAVELFSDKDAKSYQAMALALHGRVLVARGKAQEAAPVLAEAEELLASTEDVVAELTAGIDLARARAGLGEVDRATASLFSLVERANALGYGASSFEARLALAELGGLDGEELTRLESEARSAGFGLVARRVGALRAGGAFPADRVAVGGG